MGYVHLAGGAVARGEAERSRRAGQSRRAGRVDAWNVIAAVAMAVGVALRVRLWATGRSLWLDEASLARNVLQRGAGELLEPLGGQQAAPVGYLWMLRGLVELFGPGEMVLRFPSLVAGICLLPLVWAIAARVASRRAAAIAVTLAALSPGLIRYSAEMKQYSLDTAVVAAIVLAGLRVDRDRSLDRIAVFLTVGALGVWCSHAAILAVAGVGVFLVARAAWDRDVHTVGGLAVAGATCLASLGLVYAKNLHEASNNDFLDDFWATGFLHDLRPDRVLSWLWSNTGAMFELHGGFAWPGAVLAVLAGGTVLLLVRDGRAGAPAVLGVLAFLPMTLAAAALERYPYRGRVALYALPLALVLLAGVADLRGRIGRLALPVVVVLALAPAHTALADAIEPPQFPESREVVAHLAEHRSPHEPLLLHGWAKQTFDVYARRHPGLTHDGRTTWRPPRACRHDGEVPALRGRMWVMYSYSPDSDGPSDGELLRSHLDAAGHLLHLYERHDAFAARYDFDAPPDDPTGEGRLVNEAAGCLRVIMTAPARSGAPDGATDERARVRSG